MNHALFGDLQYDQDDRSWTGAATLRLFATFGESFCAGDPEKCQRQDGLLPLSLRTEVGAGPSALQIAAFEHLRARESEVYSAVLQALFASHQEYTASALSPLWDRIGNWFGVNPVRAPADMATHACFTRLEISHESRGASAYLLFHVECDWEPEHGMVIVFHKDLPAIWTTPDALELTSDTKIG